MKIIHSRKVRAAAPSPRLVTLLETITEAQLREWVERVSVPRHSGAEPEQNRATANWLFSDFASMGFRVERQGEYSNILALPKNAFEEVFLVGAHCRGRAGLSSYHSKQRPESPKHQ